MKKYYTIAVLLALAFAAQAQIADFPYNQGFESGLDGWTTIDADDDGDNWFVANDGEGGPGNHGNWYLSHSGQKVAISRGYAYGGNAYDPDNYLVSPEIEVNDDLVLEFWYAFSNPDQGSDPMLSVYVSTTGDTEADFQAGDSLTTYIAVDDDVWHLASLSLADYAGQTIRIALRHHHSYYQYHFMVDDIVIRSVNVPHVELLAPTLTGLDSTALFTATLTEGSTTGLTWQWHSTMAYNDMAYMDQFADTAATILYYGVGYDTVSVTATNSYGSHTATAVVRVFDLEPATLPYTTGFETSEDVSFITFNGDNGWTVGNSAAATGQRSLYITYDGANGQNIYNATATSPNMPHSHSYAIRALDFSTAGLYYITYDWRCKGENNYDYMRVALAPQSQTFSDTTTLGITPSALPQGWISLDDSAALSGQNTWQAATHTFSVDTAGVYWLVVYWTNDENNGSNPAGAIDNIVVDNLNCPMPKDLVLDAATDSSLAFSWTPIGDESQWGIRLDGGQWTLVDSTHHTATGLAAAMTHSVEVRAMCDDGDSSFILASDFRTLCGVAQPTWQEDFADASAAECWTFVDGDSIEPSSAQAATTWYIGANRLRAPGHVATSDDWAIAPAIALPAGATGLVLAFDASAGQNASASHPSYYEVRANAAGTTDTALFTSLLLAEPLVGTAHRTVSLDAFAGDTLRLAFVHRAEMDGGMSIDNMVVRQTLAPVAAIDGHAIGNVGFTSTFEAVLVEGVAENLYYQWSSALSTTVEADSNTFSVTYFDAGVDTVSVTVSNDHGSTTVVVLVDVRDLGAAPLPYYTGFEEGDDTDWLTASSGDNSWAIGTATAAQGTHSLYISNDGGQSNTYTFTSASNSIAYRALDVDQPGDHYLQYSWHCQGEGLITQYYDYMRVLLAPAHVDLTDHDLLQSLATSYQLPNGFINIACPVFMNGDTTSSHVVTIDQPGLYQLAFFWHNDQTVGANPPAAVDSISFGHVECALPQDLVLADATTTSLTVSWTAGGDDALWLVTVDDSLQAVVYDPEYHIDSLEPSTDHTVAVQTLCGASDTSLAVAATFRTLCAPVATLPFLLRGLHLLHPGSHGARRHTLLAVLRPRRHDRGLPPVQQPPDDVPKPAPPEPAGRAARIRTSPQRAADHPRRTARSRRQRLAADRLPHRPGRHRHLRRHRHTDAPRVLQRRQQQPRLQEPQGHLRERPGRRTHRPAPCRGQLQLLLVHRQHRGRHHPARPVPRTRHNRHRHHREHHHRRMGRRRRPIRGGHRARHLAGTRLGRRPAERHHLHLRQPRHRHRLHRRSARRLRRRPLQPVDHHGHRHPRRPRRHHTHRHYPYRHHRHSPHPRHPHPRAAAQPRHHQRDHRRRGRRHRHPARPGRPPRAPLHTASRQHHPRPAHTAARLLLRARHHRPRHRRAPAHSTLTLSRQPRPAAPRTPQRRHTPVPTLRGSFYPQPETPYHL